jgi:hypothetical protein
VIRLARSIVAVAILWIGLPSKAPAQRADPAGISDARAFASEALGGTVGSALGIAIGLAVAGYEDCPPEYDVVCPLRKLGITGIVSVAGATIGTVVAGRWAGAKPSAVGAFLGAAAGAAAGIGLEHLITEEMNRTLGDAGTIVLFSVTQGILAAAGSRIGARVRSN